MPYSGTPIRWGIGDFFLVWVGGFLLSVVGAVVGAGISGDTAGEVGGLTVALALGGQFFGYFGGLWLVSKYKGQNSLARDFGLVARTKYLWAIIAGAALQLVLGAMVYPLVQLAGEGKQ